MNSIMGNSRCSKCFILACLMVTSNYEATCIETNRDEKIIIVGAGASGIAAATKLFENGFTNITILEAENRIGGRLYTTKFGNYSVDLGGQWIQGQNNVAYKLVSPLGLLDEYNGSLIHQMAFDSSGNTVNDTLNQRISKFIRKYYLENVPHQDTTTVKSYGEFMEEAFEKEFRNDPEILKDKKTLLHYLETVVLRVDSGDSWNNVAVRRENGYIDRKGDQHVNWKTRGYGTIFDVLMKRYPDPEKELPVVNNTILNTEVTSIDYSEIDSDTPISVTTKNGQVYKADHVIVTVSLGVLKEKYKSLFIPALPDRKINAIEGLGFGTAGKVYLLFEKPFWQLGDDKKSMYCVFLWNDADKKVVEEEPEKMWTLGVSGVSTVEHKPNLLELYVPSRYAKAMEGVAEAKVFNQSVEILQRFMGRTYEIPKPLAIMRTQWFINPHFRGTYSYRDVESDKRQVYPTMLEEPITPENPKVLFAGEATSPHRFSTADGAIESGWTAANRLISFYKSN